MYHMEENECYPSQDGHNQETNMDLRVPLFQMPEDGWMLWRSLENKIKQCQSEFPNSKWAPNVQWLLIPELKFFCCEELDKCRWMIMISVINNKLAFIKICTSWCHSASMVFAHPHFEYDITFTVTPYVDFKIVALFSKIIIIICHHSWPTGIWALCETLDMQGTGSPLLYPNW